MNSVADQIIFAFLLLAMFAAGWAFCKMRTINHGTRKFEEGLKRGAEIYEDQIGVLTGQLNSKTQQLTILQRASIPLTTQELQSGLTRVRWAELLIKQLPPNHDGRNSWLLNYGTGPVFGERPADQNLPGSKTH